MQCYNKHLSLLPFVLKAWKRYLCSARGVRLSTISSVAPTKWRRSLCQGAWLSQKVTSFQFSRTTWMHPYNKVGMLWMCYNVVYNVYNLKMYIKHLSLFTPFPFIIHLIFFLHSFFIFKCIFLSRLKPPDTHERQFLPELWWKSLKFHLAFPSLITHGTM